MDFYVPAFRDEERRSAGPLHLALVQGRREWAHFICSAGSIAAPEHSEMIGWVYVMKPADYAAWLAGQSERIESMAQAGEQLVQPAGLRHVPRRG